MSDYLRSRGMAGPIWNSVSATASAVGTVATGIKDTASTVKSVTIEPIGDALEAVSTADVHDLVPGDTHDAWGLEEWIYDALWAAPGGYEDDWQDILDYDVKSLIEDAVGGAADSVTVLHGKAMDNDADYRSKYRVPQHVSVIARSDPTYERQNIFTIFGDNPYNHGTVGSLDSIKVGYIDNAASHSEGPIYGPFSKYTPTFLWPWQTQNGRRMTAAELAQVPLDGDWYGTKPIAEAVIGQELDKVGGIPGYRFFGDAALATPLLLTAVVAAFTAPLWGPPLVSATTFVGKMLLPFP